jgi:DNA-binding XRE family transcriptional regulator
MMRKSPGYRKRNEEDFEQMTLAIENAIQRLQGDSSEQATQENLAELAGCSRKTLHNREKIGLTHENRILPITELKAIQQARKSIKENSGKSPKRKSTLDQKVTVEAHINREKILIGQVINYQEENAKWFDRVQELEREKERIASLLKLAERHIDDLKKEKKELESEIRKIKQDKDSKVVSISALRKSNG